jgi:hypothetical protein
LLATEGVYVARSDQCSFGLSVTAKVPGKGVVTGPVQKATGWVSNIRELVVSFDKRRCCGGHQHIQLLGLGKVTSGTERYPPSLVRFILRHVSNRLRRDRGIPLNALERGVGTHIDEEPVGVAFDEVCDAAAEADSTMNISEGKVVAGTSLPSGVVYFNLESTYIDRYSGLHLKPDKVREARNEEIQFAIKLDAWDVKPRRECIERTGTNPFRSMWIDCNKGDDDQADFRSRWVVQEAKRVSTIAHDDHAAVSSSTPPLEVLRIFCSFMMAYTGKAGAALCMIFLDVSRAHPHVLPLRDNIYMLSRRRSWGWIHLFVFS